MFQLKDLVFLKDKSFIKSNMRKKYLLPAILLIFVACTPQNYYQLTETDSKSLTVDGEYLSYENEDIKLSYDFWGNRGNGSFIVSNKTDNDIFVDLKRSHLIINGFAFTYFQNRKFTQPNISFFSYATDEEIEEQRRISLPGVTAKNLPPKSEEDVTYTEERIICIPPQSSLMVFGFDLQDEVYRDCNLFRFPTTKQILTTEFDYNSSPLIYKNRITYSFDEKMAQVKYTENEFWAKKITNYPENSFITYENVSYCNDSAGVKEAVYPMKKSSGFYFKYKLEPGQLDH